MLLVFSQILTIVSDYNHAPFVIYVKTYYSVIAKK